MMTKPKSRRGTPAASLLSGGLSRHGRHCPCRYCREEYAPAAQTAERPATEVANRCPAVRP